MTNDPKYNLEERTTKFAEEIIRFSKKISHKPETLPLISQLVRAGTSIGANYCEADDASSKKDFLYKIGICRKEARESKYWLKIIVVAEPSLENESKVLWQEAKELHLIFAAICRRK
ncbi:MAG: four helix bundle protein [Planctomycetota bacterium]